MMTYFTLTLSGLFVVGFAVFASKPSPIFGGVGLIISGGVGCGIVLNYGGSFLGMLVFLIYLGGMLVVFGYTTAMAMEEYPEMWLTNKVVLLGLFVGLLCELLLVSYMMISNLDNLELIVSLDGEGEWVIYEEGDYEFYGEEMAGAAAFYTYGYWLMMLSGWSLVFCVVLIVEVLR
uniref:NADH-ubiquinone oxidoreductase chain 6 n=1 Tax=Echinosorex gymnura TaxID=162630 RepID=Q953K9_ECHGY|nr:NADH dehydrogenase subunit 6 [Echinosorex gymnura]AAK64233.1 NADH dehydrogenase subunit 6 [Echinosorex gymnura]